MNKMMRKVWRKGNEAALQAQVQLREGLRGLPTVRARLGKKQEGATMVEYAIMVALIAVVSIVIIGVLGEQIRDAFDEVVQAISG